MKKFNRNIYKIYHGKNSSLKLNDSENDESYEDYYDDPERVFGYNSSVSSSVHHKFRIDSSIEEPSKYRKMFDVLFDASEEDIATFFINSPGGRKDTAVEMINYIKMTRAKTFGVITSEANSAASMIALACDETVAMDNSEMLIHESSYGICDYQNKMTDHIIFQRKSFVELMKDCYKDFLTDSEIQSVLDGKDMWLSSKEINRRLELRDKIRNDSKNDSEETLEPDFQEQL